MTKTPVMTSNLTGRLNPIRRQALETATAARCTRVLGGKG